MNQIKNLRLREIGLIVLIMSFLLIGGLFVGGQIKTAKLDPVLVAQAATENPSPGSPGYWTTILPIMGSFTSTSAMSNIVSFKSPWDATLMGFQAIAQTSGSGGMTVNFKEAGTTVLSTPVAINTKTVAEAVVSDASIADEALMSIDLAITSGGTWKNPTVQIIWKRK